MSSVDEACEKLKLEGRRITPQRRAIVEVLLRQEGHLTADQILTQVRRRMASISPATVYNTLHELAEMGLVRVLDLGLGLDERRYDVATDRHDHMVCLDCGRIEDVARWDGMGSSLDEDHDFRIIDRRVTYLGFCPACVADSEHH